MFAAHDVNFEWPDDHKRWRMSTLLLERHTSEEGLYLESPCVETSRINQPIRGLSPT